MTRLLAATLGLAATAAVAASPRPPVLTTALAATGLDRPVALVSAPDDFTRLFVVEKRGLVRILNVKTGDLQPLADAFLDVRDEVAGTNAAGDERGLLGLAFHPEYRVNRRFFVTSINLDGQLVVHERRRDDLDPDHAAEGPGTVLLAVDQPTPARNGGWLGFGPNDGYLYFGVGEGGSLGPPTGVAQSLASRLGKILRIDVDGVPPYAVPPDNPYVGQPSALGEIWATGLRNPWRCAFDRATGDLWIADVGQDFWEEIDFQKAGAAGGANYGWPCYEASAPFDLAGCPDPARLRFPIHEYNHFTGPFRCALIGGAVYRGCDAPSESGLYFFGDYCSGEIWSLRFDGEVVLEVVDRTDELAPPGDLDIASISTFGEDGRGELYVADQVDGEIFRVVPRAGMHPYEDVDCDATVGVIDLLAVLSDWGRCAGCPADVDGDDIVAVSDLLAVLAEWGTV